MPTRGLCAFLLKLKQCRGTNPKSCRSQAYHTDSTAHSPLTFSARLSVSLLAFFVWLSVRSCALTRTHAYPPVFAYEWVQHCVCVCLLSGLTNHLRPFKGSRVTSLCVYVCVCLPACLPYLHGISCLTLLLLPSILVIQTRTSSFLQLATRSTKLIPVLSSSFIV